eukprot:TRINITY_DN12966_c0_g1_i1.p1 TRINITY_DN12966_c0_g1~~TRINITY_DN12966_c0_g1_i1.p1  ORF type:complete len:504 (-),score=29.20 TRINITY_DN12966_c0_g1_i1:93-1487(-)
MHVSSWTTEKEFVFDFFSPEFPIIIISGIEKLVIAFFLRETSFALPCWISFGNVFNAVLTFYILGVSWPLYLAALSLGLLCFDLPLVIVGHSHRDQYHTSNHYSFTGLFFYGITFFGISISPYHGLLGEFSFYCHHLGYIALNLVLVHFADTCLRSYGLLLVWVHAIFSLCYFNTWINRYCVLLSVSVFTLGYESRWLYPSVILIAFAILSSSLTLKHFGDETYFPMWAELTGLFYIFSFGDTRSLLREKVAVCRTCLLSLICLILSSFPLPSRGYGMFLISFYLLYVATSRRDLVNENIIRTGGILSGCLLMFLASPLENFVLFWIGLVIISLVVIESLLNRKLSSSLMVLLFLVPVMYTGLAIQSKLVVSIAGFYLFLTINVLAAVIFPTSLLFPFVLTFCGISLIYMGIKFDNDSFKDVFSFTVTEPGQIENLTAIAASFVQKQMLAVEAFFPSLPFHSYQ